MSTSKIVEIRTNLHIKLTQILYLCAIKTAKFHETEKAIKKYWIKPQMSIMFNIYDFALMLKQALYGTTNSRSNKMSDLNRRRLA